MYNRLILAEKPDMGEQIATALGIASKKRGHILLQNGDVVTWAIGHLIRLKTPDSYEPYKKWTMESLPIIPEDMQTEVDPKKLDQFNIVKGLLQNSKEIILATDPDREGEHIGNLILHQCGYTGKYKRLWIDDLTPPTIIEGMRNLRESDSMKGLADAAQARSYADYWLGFTASRYFTLLAKEATGEDSKLSAGRVQTPTLRLAYDHELAMENFVPKPFFTLTAEFQTEKGSYKGQWFRKDEEGTVNRFDDPEKAKAMKQMITGKSGTVQSYSVKEAKRFAPQLLNSQELKTAARKQLGFSAVKSTAVLQSLYDKGYVTYPRGASQHLPENKANQLAVHLLSLREKSEYAHLFPEELRSLKGNSRFVDDKKAATHHAIVPTDKNPAVQPAESKDKVTDDEAKLYEVILKHTLAAYYPEGKDQETETITIIAGESFITRHVEIQIPGWRSILKPEQETEADKEQEGIPSGRLPKLQEGMTVKTAAADLHQGQTSKPKRLYDTDLEKLMENAGRLVDESQLDDDALELIKSKGIGTPATRTNIVENITAKEYIEIKKNLVYLTTKGRSFMSMVYEHPIASIELTGEFEKKLGEVEHGHRELADLLEEFKQFTHSVLDNKEALLTRIKNLPANGRAFDNTEAIGNCPKCGNPVLEHPNVYSCSARKNGCDFAIWKDFRGVAVKVKQARELIEGKEVLLKNIPGKDEKPSYDVYLKLTDGKIETRKPTAEDNSLGKCPTCGKPVVEGPKTFGCSGWREGCKFAIWKSFRKIELTEKTVKPLLAGKEVLLKDLPSEKGPYSLYLFLKGDKLETRQPTADDKSLGACPLCGKPVIEGDKAYGCSGWRDGCKFRLGKEMLTQKISTVQMKKLLKGGKTDKILGFVNSKGSFDSALGYDKAANRYSFVK